MNIKKNNDILDDKLFDDYDIVTINDIINTEYMHIQKLDESEIGTMKNVRTDMEKDNVIIFTIDKYLQNISESYENNDDNIKKQFELDFYRNTVLLNNDTNTHIINVQTRLKNLIRYILLVI